MTNEIVRQLFRNYLLIRKQGFDAFHTYRSESYLLDQTQGRFQNAGIGVLVPGSSSDGLLALS
jgi:hypothetical protein